MATEQSPVASTRPKVEQPETATMTNLVDSILLADLQYFKGKLESALVALHSSISHRAYVTWSQTTQPILADITHLIDDRLLRPWQFSGPSQREYLLVAYLRSKINDIIIHCADVFRYFWAVLIDARPLAFFQEPIQAVCILLNRVINFVGGSITKDNYHYLLESMLPYLVLADTEQPAIAPHKRPLAAFVVETIRDFIAQILLYDFAANSQLIKAGFSEYPELNPSMTLLVLLESLCLHLNPQHQSVHFTNKFSRRVFPLENATVPLQLQLKIKCVNVLTKLCLPILENIHQRPKLLEELQLKEILLALGRVYNQEPDSPIIHRFFELLVHCDHGTILANLSMLNTELANHQESIIEFVRYLRFYLFKHQQLQNLERECQDWDSQSSVSL